ncbi:hypothetical protein [Ruminococcus sp.]|uniref:Uncharacterized protein n=1 Tax=Ruminococcus bicirculans (ex Wegman et al. 2014) TaxID=1160721 RepID=A0AAW5KTU2_9FIRM|nr:hypothetical protein [Ruminococcus bicirculans (ex Wegman et al. 2014)]
MVEEILGKNKSLKTTQMRYFQGSDLVTRTGIELNRTPDVVFSKMRKSPILRRF